MGNIEPALSELREFIEGLSLEAWPVTGQSRIGDLGMVLVGQGQTIHLSPEEAGKYSHCVEKVYTAVEGDETISRTTVERIVRERLLSATTINKEDNPAEFRRYLEAGIKQLRLELHAHPEEWEFYFAVDGVSSVGLPLVIGQVEFYLADETGIAEYWRRATDVSPEIGSAQPTRFMASDFTEFFGGSVIARIRVSAIDSEAAKNRALKLLRQTIDTVNFYISGRSGGTRMRMHIKGDVQPGLRLYPSLRLDRPSPLNVERSLTGPWQVAPLHQLSALPVFQGVSRLLSKARLNRLEDRILTAIQWAGRARVEERREQAFLFFAVALETLLLGDRNPSDLQYKLKLRCAHLLVIQNLQSRKRIFKEIGELYAKRSKIVHTGEFDVTDSELQLIEKYACAAIDVLLSRDAFQSMRDESTLEEWFESQVLGTPPIGG